MIDHLIEEARCQPHRIDVAAGHDARDFFKRRCDGLEQRHGTAVKQGAPDLQGRCIEAQPGHVQDAGGSIQGGEVGLDHKTRDPAMRHKDGFWLSCRSRGEIDVCPMIWRDA